jgi:hypothetical protein
MTHEAGKGDKQRPTDHEAFAKNFENIFGRKPPEHVSDAVHNQVMDAVNLASDPAGLRICQKENPSA